MSKRRPGEKLIVGVDEAGYGPNIGPCVVAISAWRVPNSLSEQGMQRSFARCFYEQRYSEDCQHVPFGDSKKLFRAKQGLETLEAGLLACLNLLAETPKTLKKLVDQFTSGLFAELPWYQSLDRWLIPRSLPIASVDRISHIAQEHLLSESIELSLVHARIIAEPEFNALLDQGSKGELLSLETLRLVQRTIDGLTQSMAEPVSIEVFCDRQGGRKNYLPLLLDVMPQQWFREVLISHQRCSYQNSAGNLTIHFSVGGDDHPPTSLASMMAKYLRECLMQPLNAFWQAHIPDLKPTAGYPQDAARFRAAIEHKAAHLNLSSNDWWRRK